MAINHAVTIKPPHMYEATCDETYNATYDIQTATEAFTDRSIPFPHQQSDQTYFFFEAARVIKMEALLYSLSLRKYSLLHVRATVVTILCMLGVSSVGPLTGRTLRGLHISMKHILITYYCTSPLAAAFHTPLRTFRCFGI